MPEISRNALLPYPAAFMYDIVNQVEAYPEFLPWCGGARLHQASETELEASINISVGALNKWFRTHNSMVPGESIEIELVDGPFKSLHGRWQFTELEDSACKIELVLKFEFKAGLAATLIGPVFTRIANTMVDSFCQRAREIHGR